MSYFDHFHSMRKKKKYLLETERETESLETQRERDLLHFTNNAVRMELFGANNNRENGQFLASPSFHARYVNVQRSKSLRDSAKANPRQSFRYS